MAGVLTFAYINAAEIVTLATILPLLCISAVGLRFYARVSNGYNVGVDDWLMVPGALLYVAMCICLLIGKSSPIIVSTNAHSIPRRRTQCV